MSDRMPMKTEKCDGLYHKYTVTKRDGTVVENCFVLRPDKDPHARVAIEAYAESCKEDNPALWRDLRFVIWWQEQPNA